MPNKANEGRPETKLKWIKYECCVLEIVELGSIWLQGAKCVSGVHTEHVTF